MKEETRAPAAGADEVWTVLRILEWTTGFLKKAGSDTPRLDAEILLAHTRKCPRIQLYAQFNSQLTDEERSQMRDLVKRRSKAEPVAYLVGHREFFGLDFEVSRDVLIPRPDTETLVLELIEANREVQPLRVLDLCTGSGAIAVSVAVNLPAAQLVATDISPAALGLARKNAAKHAVDQRIEFREGDLWQALTPEARFEVVASNPPYVPAGELPELDADVRDHEPMLALDGGPDGMRLLNQIVARAAEFLVPGGQLLLETGIEQSPLTKSAVEQQGSFTEVKVIRDLGQRPRVVSARRI